MNKTERVNFTILKDLLKEFDAEWPRRYVSRSAAIVAFINEFLKDRREEANPQ